MREAGYADADRLAPGDPAPDLPLHTLEGTEVRLGEIWNARPAVLIFGSYTCPPFRRRSLELERLHQSYGDRAAFVLIYIQEAHPSDGWQVEPNIRDGIQVPQPRELEERAALARECPARLGLTVPVLLDGMENRVDRAYNAWPERLYVISPEGRVVYQGGKEPYGFKPEDLEEFLKRYL